MKKRVRLGKGKAIPLGIRIGTLALLVYLFIFLRENLDMTSFIITGVLVSPVLPAMWTAQRIIEIDNENKKIHRYWWILGRKFGKNDPFRIVNKVVLESMHSSKIPTEEIYIGYLVIDDQVRIGLTRSREKDQLLTKLEKVAESLETRVEQIL